MKIILFILCGLLLLFFIGALLYHIFDWFKVFYHNILEWHKPNRTQKQWFDGITVHCTCKICNKEIMQDSQGNWFLR